MLSVLTGGLLLLALHSFGQQEGHEMINMAMQNKMESRDSIDIKASMIWHLRLQIAESAR